MKKITVAVLIMMLVLTGCGKQAVEVEDTSVFEEDVVTEEGFYFDSDEVEEVTTANHAKVGAIYGTGVIYNKGNVNIDTPNITTNSIEDKSAGGVVVPEEEINLELDDDFVVPDNIDSKPDIDGGAVYNDSEITLENDFTFESDDEPSGGGVIINKEVKLNDSEEDKNVPSGPVIQTAIHAPHTGDDGRTIPTYIDTVVPTYDGDVMPLPRMVDDLDEGTDEQFQEVEELMEEIQDLIESEEATQEEVITPPETEIHFVAPEHVIDDDLSDEVIEFNVIDDGDTARYRF